MIGSKIRQYADSGDLTSLKYIFVDALDVDPTFQLYEEDYQYCKSIPGLLEPHMELTPFTNDHGQWTEAYWAQLKMDLKKNFSDQRMTHMREVAQVLLAEKIQRLKRERQNAADSQPAPTVKHVPPTAIPPVPPVSSFPTKEEQDRKLAESRQKLEEEKRRFETEEAEKKRRREAQTRALNCELQDSKDKQGISPKKVIGIALVVAAVVAGVLLLLLKSRNPA